MGGLRFVLTRGVNSHAARPFWPASWRRVSKSFGFPSALFGTESHVPHVWVSPHTGSLDILEGYHLHAAHR